MTSDNAHPNAGTAGAMTRSGLYRKSRTRPITPGETVYLDGNALVAPRAAGTIHQYAWKIASGPEGSRAMLVNANQPRAHFVPDAAGRYVVRLEVVTSSGTLRFVKEIRVNVDDVTPVAVAKAESILVMTGAPIRLSGAASENPLSGPLFFEWRICAAPKGSVATLSYAESESAMVFPDLEGRYEVSLVVRNSMGTGTTDKVTIHVVSPESLSDLTTVSSRESAVTIDFGRTYTTCELSALKRAIRVSVARSAKDTVPQPALQPESERVGAKSPKADPSSPQRFQSLIQHIRILLCDGTGSLASPADPVTTFHHATASRR